MRHPRALAAGSLLTLLVAAPVLASHVQPEVVDGAESCGPLAAGTVELIVALPQDVGTIEEGDFTIDVTLDGSVGQGSISFEGASLPVKAAFVAGTDSGNLYTYEEPVTEDDGLVAPDGGPIKDVSFCYVGGADGGGGDDGAAPTDGSETGGETAGGDEGDGEATPPQTDTAPAPGRDATGLVLMTLGGVSLAGGLWLLLGPGRRPTLPRRR